MSIRGRESRLGESVSRDKGSRLIVMIGLSLVVSLLSTSCFLFQRPQPDQTLAFVPTPTIGSNSPTLNPTPREGIKMILTSTAVTSAGSEGNNDTTVLITPSAVSTFLLVLTPSPTVIPTQTPEFPSVTPTPTSTPTTTLTSAANYARAGQNA